MKVLKWIKKVLIASIAAFIVLNAACFFYYNVPAREKDSSGSVDYKWPSNAFHITCVEGLGYGTVNNDGFNNLLDYIDGEKIDVLWMGSSQGEGFNVKEDENMVAVFNNESNYYAYNISISEHTLMTCLENLESALKKYTPSKYVVIETMTTSFWDAEVESALNDDNELAIYDSKVMNILQNFKYLKLIYYQLNNLRNKNDTNTYGSLNNEKLFNEIISKAESVCDEYGVKLIIVYHPPISVDENNNPYTTYNVEDFNILQKACIKNNIELINMENSFKNYYLKDNVLPYGFNNTKIGYGHLNKYGHKMIAEEVVKKMEEIENDVQ